MDLSEWIIQRKEDDKTFNQKKMAADLDVDEHRLCNLIRARHLPSFRLALAVEKYTKGKVKGWDLMLKAYLRRNEKKEKQNES